MERLGEAVGPVAADDVGDGEEGAPVVGQTVGCDARQRGVVKGGDGRIGVCGPAGEILRPRIFSISALSGLKRSWTWPGWAWTMGMIMERSRRVGGRSPMPARTVGQKVL